MNKREERKAKRKIVSDAIRLLRTEPLLFFWGIVVLLDPIYIFKSGLPQPADWLLVLLGFFAIAGWNGKMRPLPFQAMRALLLFLGYVLASAFIWSVISGSWTLDYKQGYLIAPIFYLFDVYIFFVFLILYHRFGERFVVLTIRLLLVSVCLQVFITLFYSRGGTLRSYGLFNTSNQLGYYSILTASLLLLGQMRAQISTLQVVIGQLCCCYLALLSASRAALLSVAILMLVAIVHRLRVVFLLGLVAAFFIFVANPFEDIIDRTVHRIQTDETLGFIQERGYDRIAHHPEYLLLGAGEGGYARFEYTSAIRTHELHSSLGTLVFCYGFVGFGVFLAFLRRVVSGASMRRMLLMIPPAAYALSHQGLRFTGFWVLLGIVVMLNDLDQQSRRRGEVRTQ